MPKHYRNRGEQKQTGSQAGANVTSQAEQARQIPARSSLGHRFDYGELGGQARPTPGVLSVQWIRCWMTGLTTPPGWAAM